MEANLLERVAVKHFEVMNDRDAVLAAALACGTPVEQTERFLRDEPGPWVLLDLCVSAQSRRWVMQPQRYLASVLANTRLWTLEDGTPKSAVSQLYQLDAFDPRGKLPGPATIALVLASRAIQEPSTEAGGTTYEGFYVLRFLLFAPLARVDHLDGQREFKPRTARRAQPPGHLRSATRRPRRRPCPGRPRQRGARTSRRPPRRPRLARARRSSEPVARAVPGPGVAVAPAGSGLASGRGGR
jgi:hypothetical protein